MSHTMKKLVVGGISALSLLGATALSANAAYLGYGNGDPGNWDLWTEQHGGPMAKAAGKPYATAHVHRVHHIHHAHARTTTKHS